MSEGRAVPTTTPANLLLPTPEVRAVHLAVELQILFCSMSSVMRVWSYHSPHRPEGFPETVLASLCRHRMNAQMTELIRMLLLSAPAGWCTWCERRRPQATRANKPDVSLRGGAGGALKVYTDDSSHVLFFFI